jgi:molybdopterin synthase catalytic subunit
MSDKLFEITTAPTSVDEVSRRVSSPAVGAVVSFGGIVRGTNASR